MKSLAILALVLLTCLTAVERTAAETGQSVTKTPLNAPLDGSGMWLNPQIGVSSLSFSDTAGSKAQPSGGVTVEVGPSPRLKFETGLLALRTDSQLGETSVNSTSLAVPL